MIWLWSAINILAWKNEQNDFRNNSSHSYCFWETMNYSVWLLHLCLVTSIKFKLSCSQQLTKYLIKWWNSEDRALKPNTSAAKFEAKVSEQKLIFYKNRINQYYCIMHNFWWLKISNNKSYSFFCRENTV